MQWRKRRLDCEDHQQKHCCDTDAHRGFWPDFIHPDSKIRHVQRTRFGID